MGIKSLQAVCIAAAFVLLAAACGPSTAAPAVQSTQAIPNSTQAPSGMQIQDAWLYPPAIDNTAVYFTLVNPGDADKLLSVSLANFQSAELHESVETNNMIGMQSFNVGIEVPANGTLIFKPGSYHIMATGPLHALVAGDKLALTLMFSKAPALTVQAVVRAP